MADRFTWQGAILRGSVTQSSPQYVRLPPEPHGVGPLMRQIQNLWNVTSSPWQLWALYVTGSPIPSHFTIQACMVPPPGNTSLKQHQLAATKFAPYGENGSCACFGLDTSIHVLHAKAGSAVELRVFDTRARPAPEIAAQHSGQYCTEQRFGSE